MRRVVTALSIYAVLASPLALADEKTVVETITARAGGAFAVALLWPAGTPKGAVVLLTGGDGRVDIASDGAVGGDQNFLLAHRAAFTDAGYLTAIPDAPADKRAAGLKTTRFRVTAAHATDLGAVVARLRAETNGPVILVGTSRGAIGAANAAARLTGPLAPDALVLTATVGEARKTFASVFDVPLGKITAPTLVLHHEGDACPSAPASEVPRIAKALSSAASVTVKRYRGGTRGEESDWCNRFSHHGFYGIEPDVLTDLMAWIGKTTAR